MIPINLSQLTASISRSVAADPALAAVWVTAELSDVRIAGGHCYMELIEKNPAGQTVAKLRATIWQSTFNPLRRKFFQATGRDIVTGLKVLIRGSVSHHSLYGLSFNISDIDPSYTMGDLERLRREILQRLATEGILDANKSRPLPQAPQRIAIISAEGAAGYGDFINQLTHNPHGFVYYPCLFPAAMQGDRVSASVRDALSLIEATADLWDCVVIIRGGGATTDLNGFDDYELARAVALCGLPVIVGIGHERDRNVLDDVAHTSLKTPTAVAAFFVDRLRFAFEAVMDAADSIRRLASEKMRGEEQRLAAIRSLVPQLALRRLADHEARLRALAGKLPLLVTGRIGKENARLVGRTDMLSSLAAARIANGNRHLDNTLNLLKVLDPVNTLRRGYSITRIDGKALRDPADAPPGTILTTRLLNGTLTSTV